MWGHANLPAVSRRDLTFGGLSEGMSETRLLGEAALLRFVQS